jgi:hypothetical protein
MVTTLFDSASQPIGRQLAEAFPAPEKPAAKEMSQDELFGTLTQIAYQIFGSRVASPTQDRYNQWSNICLTNDARQLYSAYIKVREMFSETTLNAANKRRSRGAVCKGFTHEFSPVFNTPEAEAAARWANDLTKPAAEMLIGTGWNGGGVDYSRGPDRPVTLADISEQLGRYCNYPLVVQCYKSGGLRQLTPLPPLTWVINTDANFQWKDPEAAYIQFDPATGKEVDNGRVPAKNMVWLSANHDPDQRYGFPEAFNAAVFVDSFRALVEGLEEARINGSPFPVFLTQGKDGRGYNVDELKKLKESLPLAMKERGQRPGAFDFWKILNGVADAKTLSVGTDFFNQFGDADLFRQHMAMTFGISIAIVLGDATFNRATLELLLRMESATQRLWAAHLTLVGVFPLFRRVLDSAGIDKSLVKCDLKWNEERTPEEAAAIATFAKECWQDGLVSEESAHAAACNYIDVDPEVDKKRKEEEQQKGKKPPAQSRQNVRISGLNPKMPLLQLPDAKQFANTEDQTDKIN